MKRALLIILILIFPVCNSFSQDSIKAKIAVLYKYGNNFAQLKSNDRVKAGDMIRIFVQPENKCNIYVIYSDENEALLLFDNEKVNAKDIIILPSEDDFYTFDENNSKAKVTIFCSSKKINDIDEIFKNNEQVNISNWNSVEAELIKKNRKNLNDRTDKPFAIAGNVSAINDDFLAQIQSFSGNNMLIRKYELEVKK